MFKIVSAEIKKMLSKPGIYILAVLLAVVLVLGILIYEPTVYADTSIQSQRATVIEVSDEFYIEGTVNQGIKAEIDEDIDDAVSSITNYRENGISIKDDIDELIDTYKENLRTFRASGSNTSTTLNIEKDRVISSLDALNESILRYINMSQNGSYVILTTVDNFDNYQDIYNNIKSLFDITFTESPSNIDSERESIRALFSEYDRFYRDEFENCLDSFFYPNISDEFILNFTGSQEDSKINILNERLDNIYTEIVELKSRAIADEAINRTRKEDMLVLINAYKNTADTYINLVKNELLSNAFSIVSTKDQLNLMYLSSESEYDANSLTIRYNYLFDNNKTEDDYAHPLTIGVTSNHEVNAYDYAYFVLRVFSFIIIVYAVMTACHSIAGEVKEGSMRYLAMRPVGRTGIYFGKLFAILIMSLILILFSIVISLIVGGFVYGLDSLTILTIFNSSIAITLHPIGMILIYVLSLFLELMIYVSIAMLLSSLLKSDLFAVTILLVLYLINTLLPMFAGGVNSWLTYYPFSHISLYALFGSSNYAVSSNFFNLLLGAKVYAGTNLILTLAIIAVIILVCNLIATRVFKKKEL